jgi:uncharacterized protein DUF4118
MGTRRDRHPTSDDRTRTRPLYDWRVTVRRGSSWRSALTTAGIASATLAVATAAVFLAEDLADVSDASTIYLFAVALVAYLSGSWAAVGSALAAFLLYNFLFVPPRFTFQVAAPQQILNLAILLVAGVGIARLTGLLRDHAQRSERREREARSLFAIGELIAGAKRIGDAFAALVTDLAVASGMDRVWIGLGPTLPLEQVAGDSAPPCRLSGPTGCFDGRRMRRPRGSGSVPRPGCPALDRTDPPSFVCRSPKGRRSSARCGGRGIRPAGSQPRKRLASSRRLRTRSARLSFVIG